MPAKSTQFELLVKDLLATSLRADIPNAQLNATHNKLHEGKSGHKHQIDVSFELNLGGIDILILIECKQYSHSVGIDDVMEFAFRLRDIGAHKGVIVTTVGFQEGALKVARSERITLVKAILNSKSKGNPFLEFIGTLVEMLLLLANAFGGASVRRDTPETESPIIYEIQKVKKDSLSVDRDDLLFSLIIEMLTRAAKEIERRR